MSSVHGSGGRLHLAVFVAALAWGSGCSNTTNSGGANPNVPIAGQTCAPATQAGACGVANGHSAHLRCDAVTKAWTTVDECAVGSACTSAGGAFVCTAVSGTQDTVSGSDGLVADAVGTDALTKDTSKADTAVVIDVNTGADACGCLTVGDYFRVSTWQFTTVDGDPDFAIVPVLNSLWQSDIDAFELNLLLRVADVSAADVTWEVVDAARVGSTQEPCLLPATATLIHQKRKGCALLDSDAGSLNVYQGSEQHPKTCGYLAKPSLGIDDTLPIRGAMLSGTLAADCSAIANGTVASASIAEDALSKICVCQTTPGQSSDVCATPDPSYQDPACGGCGNNWQSFGVLLSAFAGDAGLKYSCKSDAGQPAMCLTATFTANKVTGSVPQACGGS